MTRTAGMPSVGMLSAILLSIVLMDSPIPARAQPYPVPDTWGGDIWTRPRLTGDWGGLRDDLGKKGVVLDVDLMTTPLGILSGGAPPGGGNDFWGSADYTLNVDTGKLGLWPGGFFNISGDTGFGSVALRNSGAVVPINAATLYPGYNNQTSALTNAMYWQFLSTKFGLFLGKIDTFNLSSGEFTGDYRTQFMNEGLVFPMTLLQVPISAYGGGIIALPWEGVTLTAMVLDPNGTPTSNDLGHAFDDGALVFGSGQVTVKPWGLVGHQSLAFSWTDQEHFSLDQDPANLFRLLLQERFPRLANPGPIMTDVLQRFFPGLLVPTRPPNRKASSWSIMYSFDQYFWQPDDNPKHGLGVFFSFGASDGNPNPVNYSFAAGIGGNGVVPGRPDDSFGIGYTKTEFSAQFLSFLRDRLNVYFNHEDAIELYYNAALTPWLNVTPDLQIIGPALNKVRSSDRRLTNVDTAVVLGARVRIRF